jgi:hypothetical protein
MKKAVLLAATILCTHQAYALHWLNCSNADQTFRIQEKEVWGANPVSCTFRGETVKGNVVVLDKNTVVVLNHAQGSNPREFTTDFAATAYYKGAGDDLIPTEIVCHEESDAAVDFSHMPNGCRVER